ncbi:MAG TPA: TIR domain-containing protein [Solirubrobacteraceae bacterium]|jgi:hypothetical protein|nr:TIR domain-containing protein [Solirubrobacteraceae bacterium]
MLRGSEIGMARKVYFSFHFQRDYWRVGNVRGSRVISGLEKTPFYDGATWEKLKRKGDRAVQAWIERELKGTSVTVVLVGAQTAGRRWVKYEIRRSLDLGKGLMGIDISKIANQRGVRDRSGPNLGSLQDVPTATAHLASILRAP